MSCSHTVDCPLFAQFAMEPALDAWKQHFCEGDYMKCERYQRSLKGEVVPLNLLPNGKMIESKAKSKEEMGGTALFNAILKGRASMVKSMFASKMATANVVSSDGSTPLMAAASVGNIEIIDILLQAGCNPFAKNQAGYTAVKVAEVKGYPECASIIQEFMNSHPELESKNSSTKADKLPEEEEEMKGVVSFLKKLNPFSK